MLSLSVEHYQQIPLIHEVHVDDQRLLNTIDGEWFENPNDPLWLNVSKRL